MEKKPKTATDVAGVHVEWDEDTDLRELIRTGGTILKAPACQDISTCIKHEGLLKPVLALMALKEERGLPAIDQLKIELETLFQKNKQGVESEFLDVSKKAWMLKKLCGFVKTKARRREVSTATRWQLHPLYVSVISL